MVGRIANKLEMQKEKRSETDQEEEEEKETKVVEAEPGTYCTITLSTSHLVSISSLQVFAPIS